MKRLVLTAALLCWLPVLAGQPAPAASLLTLNGKMGQGSLIRGQVPADSRVLLNGEPLMVNGQGKFVFGFAREAAATHLLRVETPSGQIITRELQVPERDYNIQRIDGLASNMVTPPQAVLDRIRQDGTKVAKARSGKRDYDAVFTRFRWPAKGPITGVYGSQRVLNGVPKRPHFGVDVGGPTGTAVVAPAAGIVTLADNLYYSGNTIILDHGMGVFSTFLHLDTMAVKVGATIPRGGALGTIGASGRATGPHLDWRINWGTMRLDPQSVVHGTPDTD